MALFEVTGGRPLKGEITAQGAKNEALEVICATLLTPERVTIANVPDIVDVVQLIELLEKMGVQTRREAPGTWSFRAAEIDLEYMKTADFRERATTTNGARCAQTAWTSG